MQAAHHTRAARRARLAWARVVQGAAARRLLAEGVEACPFCSPENPLGMTGVIAAASPGGGRLSLPERASAGAWNSRPASNRLLFTPAIAG
ncbi:hypothetical protein [Streptomyces sp. NPDC051546]|uniref:hypothetical protein n=1 Tax=Streptomyces sp. NPDC051546 TaxID=3365655 RepID=UPI0037A91DA2